MPTLCRLLTPRLVTVLEAYGYYTAGEWQAAWELAWKSNLESCDAGGSCMIQVT